MTVPDPHALRLRLDGAFVESCRGVSAGRRAALERAWSALRESPALTGLALGALDVTTVNAWVTTTAAPATGQRDLPAVVRRVLGQFRPSEIHPSLLVDGEFDWSPDRSTRAVALTRAGKRTWVDPDRYPRVPFADSVAALLRQVPTDISAGHADEFGQAVRSLLGHLNERDSTPPHLEWLTADHLDAWVEALKATGTTKAYPYGARVRDLLTNRPDGVAVHASLLSADGHTFTWQPRARSVLAVSTDLPFSTVAAVRAAAAADVRNAVARVREAARLANSTLPTGGGISGATERSDIYRQALAGQLSAAALEEAFGATPDGWPSWLRELLPAERGKQSWAARAAAAIHAQVFPTALEVTAGYVLMLLATGLPPESVMRLESSWFQAPRRADGRYGPVSRLRYAKDRAGTKRDGLLFSTRTPDSPLRVRDRVLRMTAGLRVLADSGDADRLWLTLTPKTVQGAAPTVTHLSRIQIGHADRPGGAGPFTAWVSHRRLTDPEHIQRWNRQRAAQHATRARRHATALRHLTEQPVGLLGHEPFRPFTAWTGPVAPQRLRKTLRVRDIVLHGPHGAARDHTTTTLARHYTRSETLRVLHASAIRDAQAGLVAFASEAQPTLLAATNTDDLNALADLLDIRPDELRSMLSDGARLMRNGLACTSPTDPPGERSTGTDGHCAYLGSPACLTCPAAVAVTDGLPLLHQELRRLQRTAHVQQDNEAVTRSTDRYRRNLETLIGLLDTQTAPATVPAVPPATDARNPGPAVPRRRRRA